MKCALHLYLDSIQCNLVDISPRHKAHPSLISSALAQILAKVFVQLFVLDGFQIAPFLVKFGSKDQHTFSRKYQRGLVKSAAL
jgi:hypothetical protein